MSYPGHFEVRHVASNGTISVAGRTYFLSETLDQQDVGLEEIDDGLWTVYFVNAPIARLSERTRSVEAAHESRDDLSVTGPAAVTAHG